MKKLNSFSIAVVAVVSMMVLSACGGGGSAKASGSSGGKTPSALVTTLWDKIQKGKYDDAVKFMTDNANVKKGVSDEQRARINAVYKGLMEMRKKDDAANGGIKKVEVTDEQIGDDGNSANVKIVLTYGNGETEKHDNHVSKDEDGNWKFGTKPMG